MIESLIETGLKNQKVKQKADLALELGFLIGAGVTLKTIQAKLKAKAQARQPNPEKIMNRNADNIVKELVGPEGRKAALGLRFPLRAALPGHDYESTLQSTGSAVADRIVETGLIGWAVNWPKTYDLSKIPNGLGNPREGLKLDPRRLCIIVDRINPCIYPAVNPNPQPDLTVIEGGSTATTQIAEIIPSEEAA